MAHCLPDWLAWMLKKLRKWAHPSNMTALLEMWAELSTVSMKRKNDTIMLSDALSEIKDKYENSGVSVDKTELVAVLIATAPKD